MATTITVNANVINSMGYNNWWCPCGITPVDVVATYQPKGAASYAASKINLANPGTHDAYDVVGHVPGWSVGLGWDGMSTYLKSTIVPNVDQSWSVLVRFSGVLSEAYICGCGFPGGPPWVTFTFQSMPAFSYVDYENTSYLESYSAPMTSGVLGFAGNKAYRNGVQESGTIPKVTIGTSRTANPLGFCSWLGIENSAGCYVQAEVWYNKVLTPTQMATVSSAMAAL
jgi:hypothetical protein